MRDKYDAIVIGLGAMGSASVYQIAKRGLRVLGIDRFSPPHQNGSTHGATRIMRLAIGEGCHYTPLSKRSYELFRVIEKETDTKLLEVTGMLTISSADTAKIVPEGEFFDNTLAAARQYNVRHDVLNASEIRARFPQFKVQEDERGYFEYDAGYLRPEECVRAQLLLAQKHGASIHTDETVSEFDDTTNGVTVKTDRGTYFAEQVVVSAGPWITELVDQHYREAFKVYRLVQCWFDIAAYYDDFAPGRFPIFFWQRPGFDRWMFGFPALNGAQGGLKLSAADHAAAVTADTVNRKVDQFEIDSVYDEYVANCLPNIGRRAIKADICLYTATPNGGFVIDRPPYSARTIICSPCSGHGFKHSAAIGECIAELVTNGKSTIDLSSFSINRLAGTFSRVSEEK